MRLLVKRQAAALSAVWALASISANAAELIQNGSFENGPDPGSFTNLDAGSAAITGWTVVGSTIDYVGTLWVAADGARSLDLDGSKGPPYTHGGVAQTFATLAGASYTVSFDMAGNPASGPTVKPMEVSAAGQSAVFTFDITGKSFSDMGWTANTWTFVAASTTTTLTFQSLTTAPDVGWGPALDNVSVMAVAVPEPASAWLIAAGTLGVLMHRRGRRDVRR